MRTLGNDKKGITPVVAIIILVAVAIAVSIAAAMWLIGLTGTYTRTEEVKITAAYWDAANNRVVIRVNNTGTIAVTIDDVYINDIPYEAYYPSTPEVTISEPHLDPGEGTIITIEWAGFKSGVSYEIGVHTASGNLYTTVVTIP